MYYQQVKPIGMIKQEIRKYSRNIGYLRLSSIGIIVAFSLSIFLLYYGFFLIIPLYLVTFGVAIYNIFCVYKLSKSLEELGVYYIQESPSAKKAGEMLKISLILTFFTGVFGYIFLAIAYYRISETFKELNLHKLYPRKESRLLFYSIIGSSISFTLYISAVFSFFFAWTYTDFIGSIVFLSLSGLCALGSFIGEIVGYFKLSNDVLLILERAPSTVVYQQPVYAQPVYAQPIQPQASYQQPVVNPPTNEANIFFCSDCGAQIVGNISFCPKCGIKIDPR